MILLRVIYHNQCSFFFLSLTKNVTLPRECHSAVQSKASKMCRIQHIHIAQQILIWRQHLNYCAILAPACFLAFDRLAKSCSEVQAACL